ncbi:MAG: tetratricopeptide repeat protein [Cyanobacteriota bacterium]
MSQNSQNVSPSGSSNPKLPYCYETIPQSGVSQFVGRDRELESLHQMLQENDQVAIAGITGIGKTEIAIQYAKANVNHYQGGICWLLARADMGVQIVELVRSHFPHFTIPDNLTPTAQVTYCWQYWTSLLASHDQESNQRVLVIIDHVTDYTQIQPYLPSSSRFKVLITTRLQLENPVQILPLGVLTPPAALELLASSIGTYRVKDTRGKPFGITSKQGKTKTSSAPNQEVQGGIAQQLCELLGYLPLGVELMGRYLEQERNLSLEKMRSRLQKQLLASQSLILHQDDSTRNLATQLGVAAVFELTWNRLNQEVQELGCLLSLFALAPIPWAQVESVYGQVYLPGALLGKLLDISQQDSEAEIENLIQSLLENLEVARSQIEQWHLLQCTAEKTYQLHPLIWELLREKLHKLELSKNIKDAFCQVMVAVAKQIPDSSAQDLIEAAMPAIPHLIEATTTLQYCLSEEDLIECYAGLGWFYQSQGFYDQAAPWREQELSLTQAHLGSDHPDVASKLNNLAWIYYAQERYAEAEPLSVKALEICEQHLGLDHPFTVATRKNVEALYSTLQQS